MKLAYLYGIDRTNPYLSTYSHYPIFQKISFTNQIKGDKPLLIIGINKARELYGDKVSIGNNHIVNNIYWCHSPEEYLSEFLKRYEHFLSDIFNLYLKLINFEIIDVFFKRLHNKNELLSFLEKKQIDLIYQRGKVIYCYSKFENKTYIININEFFWFKLLSLDDFNEFTSKYLYYNDIDNSIFNYFNNLFSNHDIFFIEKSISYFLFLNHQKSQNKVSLENNIVSIY
jgi:hypothetical protein